MKIYQTRTPISAVVISVFVAVAFFFLGALLVGEQRASWMLWIVLASGCGYFFYTYVKNSRIINKLTVQRAQFAKEIGARFSPIATDVPQLQQVAMTHIPKSRDEKFWNYIEGDDWQYCDFRFNIYKKTKHGEYLSRTMYYGIMFTQLPRKLPNVFFDSKNSRGRQFRFTFSSKQKHSLEGNFDDHFVTYFPEQYTIDSMSFITPDVMHKLIDASEYDIEIIDNIVCLYGPIYTRGEDLKKMSAKLLAIKAQLLNNILTYRDERLPYSAGRQTVSIEGMKLKPSKFLARAALVLTLLYILFQIIVNHTSFLTN